MKRIVFVTVVLAAAAAVASTYTAYPNEFDRVARLTDVGALRVWESIEAYPLPMFIALGTFLITVVYHKAKGLSLRQSVEAAATRVTVVEVPARETAEQENPVIARARARAMRTQLLADQIGLENRQRKLPDEVLKAEKETCYTEQAVADAKRALGEKHKVHNQAVAKLKALRDENARSEAELAEIAAELSKLAERI